MEPTTTSISIGALFKNLTYVAAFMASVAYFKLVPETVVILAALLILDFITGVIRSALVDGPQSIKSSIALRGFISKILVFLIPFVVAATGKGIGVDLSILAQSSISVFILSMAYSILGNVRSIQTGEAKQEFDAIQYIMSQVKDLLKNIIHEDA